VSVKTLTNCEQTKKLNEFFGNKQIPRPEGIPISAPFVGLNLEDFPRPEDIKPRPPPKGVKIHFAEESNPLWKFWMRREEELKRRMWAKK